MKSLTFNNGTTNETVNIVSLVKIGPKRLVATTTEGFEIDLHESHIVEEEVKETAKIKAAMKSLNKENKKASKYFLIAEKAEEKEAYVKAADFNSMMEGCYKRMKEAFFKFTQKEAEYIFDNCGVDFCNRFEDYLDVNKFTK
jgi:hypothetical protein